MGVVVGPGAGSGWGERAQTRRARRLLADPPSVCSCGRPWGATPRRRWARCSGWGCCCVVWAAWRAPNPGLRRTGSVGAGDAEARRCLRPSSRGRVESEVPRTEPWAPERGAVTLEACVNPGSRIPAAPAWEALGSRCWTSSGARLWLSLEPSLSVRGIDACGHRTGTCLVCLPHPRVCQSPPPRRARTASPHLRFACEAATTQLTRGLGFFWLCLPRDFTIWRSVLI